MVLNKPTRKMSDSSDSSADPPKPPAKRRYTFWEEFDYVDFSQVKFSPFGSASLDLPLFYREVVQNLAQTAPVQYFQYTLQYGSREFRQAAIDHFAEVGHLKGMDPDLNVMCNLGATEVISYWTTMLMESDQDEAVLFEPYYPIHFKGFDKQGTPRTSVLKFNSEQGVFQFDWEDLEAKLNKNTRLVILCNPSNPSARVASEAEYARLTEILDRHPQVKVIEDCAYVVYLNKGQKMRFFHEFGDNFKKTITVFSAGKVFNTTGNRLGFSFSHPSLTQRFKAFLTGQNCPGAADQLFYAAAFREALKPYQNYPNYWDYIAADIAHRIDYVTQKLAQVGVKAFKNEGSYYLTVDAVALSKVVAEKYYFTLGPNPVRESYRDRAVCRKLILKHGVGLVPFSGLSALDKSPFDCFIRIPCNRSYSELDLFLKAVKKVIDNED